MAPAIARRSVRSGRQFGRQYRIATAKSGIRTPYGGTCAPRAPAHSNASAGRSIQSEKAMNVRLNNIASGCALSAHQRMGPVARNTATGAPNRRHIRKNASTISATLKTTKPWRGSRPTRRTTATAGAASAEYSQKCRNSSSPSRRARDRETRSSTPNPGSQLWISAVISRNDSWVIAGPPNRAKDNA